MDERPQEGQVAVSVELSALCSPDARPGRFSEAAHCLNEQARASGWTSPLLVLRGSKCCHV